MGENLTVKLTARSGSSNYKAMLSLPGDEKIEMAQNKKGGKTTKRMLYPSGEKGGKTVGKRGWTWELKEKGGVY